MHTKCEIGRGGICLVHGQTKEDCEDEQKMTDAYRRVPADAHLTLLERTMRVGALGACGYGAKQLRDKQMRERMAGESDQEWVHFQRSIGVEKKS